MSNIFGNKPPPIRSRRIELFYDASKPKKEYEIRIVDNNPFGCYVFLSPFAMTYDELLKLQEDISFFIQRHGEKNE